VTSSPDLAPSGPRPAIIVAGAAGAGLVVGGLTAYAQEWLPAEVGSLANSAGSRALVAFGLAALLVGPPPGLAAHWVRAGQPMLAAIGVAAMSGVLVGEGAYGLAFVADTTYPPYWWGSIVAGLALLAWIAA